MITTTNFMALLKYKEFTQRGNILKKEFPEYNCSMSADFLHKKLHYPDSMKGKDRNTSFDKPENFVVFECVCRLLDKGYRPEHIELEKAWPLGHEQKSGRADIRVSDTGENALFIIECKRYGKDFDKAYRDTLSDGAQLFSYWQQEQSAKWLVLYASDWREHEIVYKAPTINCSDDPNIATLAKENKNIRLYSNAYTACEKYSVWKDTYYCPIHDDLIFSEDTQAYNIGLIPKYKRKLIDFTTEDKIVNQFEEILRHNNVSDKENAFNRLIALFICKLVDEITKNDNDVVEFQYKQGTDTFETLQDRLQRLYTEGMEKFMGEKIFYVPSDYPEQLFSNYTGHQREKAIKDLKEKIKILKFYSNNDFSFQDVHNEMLFYQNGKILVEVVKLFEKYRIVYPSKHQFLGDLFEQLLNKGFKQNEGQYFTPIPIARFIWDSLPLEKITHSEKGFVYPKIIDYACGAGHFLTEAVEAINDYSGTNTDNTWVRDCIFGIEKDYRLARVSKISLFMNGAGDGNIIFGDGLDNVPDKQIENGAFDILVANPPYSVSAFKSHLQLKNNSFELLERIGENGSEIEVLFVERISQLLKAGGIAAVILPSSILSNDSGSYTGAREQLLQNFYIRSIVKLGGKTFGATNTNTVILFLENYGDTPKRSDLAKDSVNAILNGDDLSGWEDECIYEEYLLKIDVSNEIYRDFISETIQPADYLSDKYFKMYVDAFYSSTETQKYIQSKTYSKLSTDEQRIEIQHRFYHYAKKIEHEKLLYFALTYTQRTLIISAPAENAKQKEFLGYDWSNRKGSEGIQIISPGGRLYSNSDRQAKDTLACLIRESFAGLIPALPEVNKDYAVIMKTCDMLDFSRTAFNKAFITTAENKTEIISKYSSKPLETLLSEISGSKTRIPQSEIKESGSVPVVTQERGNLIAGYTDNKDTIKDLPLIVFGDHTSCFKYIDFEFIRGADGTQLLKTRDDEIITKYLYNYLLSISITNSDKYERHMKYLKQIPVPIPPLEIQKLIIDECQTLDDECGDLQMKIDNYRKKIENLFDTLQDSAKINRNLVPLRDVVEYNPSKAILNSLPADTEVSFVEMASVSNNGYIEKKVDRLYSEVKTGSYTYFAENDIIIAKITPCMENGKCAVARGLTNGIGMGSSEFHVIRCRNNVMPDYIFGLLNRTSVRLEAAKNMTGASGHRRVPIAFYENISIPFLPLEEQEKIIFKAQTLIQNIENSEKKLNSKSGKKTEILKKYLT